jgi:dipeptidyl aminopeptidase/acylaminoacyl peptidase
VVAIRPYGTWPSSLDAVTVARAGYRPFAALHYASDGLRWSESRPSEGGRIAIVSEASGELTPPGANARTRVHEYGGGAVWYDRDDVYYSEFTDGRVYRVGHGPVTPAHRYADGTVHAGRIVCVRERHEADGVVNELVSFPADGSAEPELVAGGRDFYMAPRFSPDGARLAWLEWDHPRMPWDGTELVVDGALVAGGPEESVLDPQWSPGGELRWLSDRTGWWNLEGLTSLSGAEIGFPAWVFAMSRYAFLDEGRILCVVTRDAVDSLHLLEGGELRDLGLEWTSYAYTFAVADGKAAFIAGSPYESAAIVELDVESGEQRVVKRSLELALDRASISVPRAIEFGTRDGATAHAFFYPPTNAEWEGPDDELPPLRVICHGGPTSHSEPAFDVEIQYFTQRGFGVVDVNYRGSTGYGRAYRRLLNGRWGEIDWSDCADAASHLASTGEGDGARTWVEGGSAGGYVVFCALCFEPASFAAGVSYFGVADLEPFVTDTHKFEERYLDTLVGPYPEAAELYRERSPIHVADRLERPMLLLQGLDDKVVPPSQAEMMVEVLERKGVPYEYIAFEGEGHGFRKEENVVRSLEATVEFVGRVFGF